MSYDTREPLLIQVSQPSDGLYRVALAGEIDLACAPELAQAFAAFSGTTYDRVVVDLSELSFIDSSGIKALIAAAKVIQAEGRVMTLVGAGPNVQRVLDIVNLSAVMPIERSEVGAAAQKVTSASRRS